MAEVDVDKIIEERKKDSNYGSNGFPTGYYTINDFTCKCGHCGSNHISHALVKGLNAAVKATGGRIKPQVTSGVRCRDWNNHEGGAPQSNHMYGDAADLAVPSSMNIDTFYNWLRAVKVFTCITKYPSQGFIHVDMRADGDPENPYDFSKDSDQSNPVNPNSGGSDGSSASTTAAEELKIIKFLQLITATKFGTQMTELFSSPGFDTLYTKIQNFISQYFYNFYSIPNLPNNKCIMVKPETLFGSIPFCNVILPCMKTDISFSREYKQEPTRTLLVTPVTFDLSGNDSPTKLGTIAAMKSENECVTVPFTGQAGVKEQSVEDIPMYKIEEYESMPTADNYKNIGMVRILPSTGGAELTAYISAYHNTFKDQKIQKEEVGKVLSALSKYMLLRGRYGYRGGSINMYFNPYIIPGFPMASLERSSDSTEATSQAFDIYGYVTNVVHNFTDRTWNTTINYSYAFFDKDKDKTPNIYPVVEDAYIKSAAETTYKNLLSSQTAETPATIGCAMSTEIKNEFKDLTTDDTSIIDAYKKIKRDATTLVDFCKFLGCSSELKTEKNYSYIEDSTYFNKTIQDTIKKYSEQVFNDKLAFSMNDMR